MTNLFPPHEAVAQAIVAACRETGGDPIKVAGGESDPGRGQPVDHKHRISRARVYAAFALARVYPEVARPVIARLVGAHSYGSFFSSAEGRIAVGSAGWFLEHVLARVVAAIEDGAMAHTPRGHSNIPGPETDLKPSSLDALKAEVRRVPSMGERQAQASSQPKPPGERMRALRDSPWHSLPAPQADSPKPQPRSTPTPAPYKMGGLPMHDPRKLGKPDTEAPATRLKRVMGEMGPPRRTAVEEGLERRASERKECRDILAEAARNTAALPIPKAPGDEE